MPNIHPVALYCTAALGALLFLLGLAVFALSLGVLGSVFIERYRNVASYFVGG